MENLVNQHDLTCHAFYRRFHPSFLQANGDDKSWIANLNSDAYAYYGHLKERFDHVCRSSIQGF